MGPIHSSTTLQNLAEGSIRSPSGQFGSVLTEEIVKVPTSAIAFISIRARVNARSGERFGIPCRSRFQRRLLFAV